MYILYGQEPYFIDKALAILKEKIVPSPELETFLYHPLAGSEVEAARLHDLASTPPFIGDRQLVLVRRAGELLKSAHDLLVRYADDPAPFTCMVFEAGPSTPKGALFRKIQERDPDACIEFPRLKSRDLLTWVCRIGKEKGIREPFVRPLAEEIVSAVGPDLKAIEQEMEKLALCLRDPAAESASDVAQTLVCSLAQDESYRLADDLLRGDWVSGIRVLHRLLANGTPPLVVLSRISWAIRRLWQVKEAIDRGESMDRLCTRLRLPYPAGETYKRAASKTSWQSLKKLFICLEETDRLLKTSRLAAQIHLEYLCGAVASELSAPGPKTCGPRNCSRDKGR